MKTVVVTTGGLGTRMLTFTKINPKTMLPIYTKSIDSTSNPLFQPLVETIFENLYDNGFRRFCFIVGEKTKSSIISHLVPDMKFLDLLKNRGFADDKRFINKLLILQKKFLNCEIKWVSQETPTGFGDALLKAKNFVGDETFLLHAGDTYFPDYAFLKKFVNNHEKTQNVHASVLVKKMKNLKGYGIAQMKLQSKQNFIINVEEKPKQPKSNYAILPVYIFKSSIFDALKNTKMGYKNELQVTDAISKLIKCDKKILGFNYGNSKWFDIGSPENYFHAIIHSYKKSTR